MRKAAILFLSLLAMANGSWTYQTTCPSAGNLYGWTSTKETTAKDITECSRTCEQFPERVRVSCAFIAFHAESETCVSFFADPSLLIRKTGCQQDIQSDWTFGTPVTTQAALEGPGTMGSDVDNGAQAEDSQRGTTVVLLSCLGLVAFAGMMVTFEKVVKPYFAASLTTRDVERGASSTRGTFTGEQVTGLPEP